MKIAFFTRKINIVALFVLFISCACTKNMNQKEYLAEVLENLNGIRSATYFAKGEGWAPADTAAYAIFYNYFEEYDNPADSTIGASYVRFSQNDTTQPNYCYDGNIRAMISHEKKSITVDDFTINRAPFRVVPPPFFNHTKSILKYILETQDSISINFEEVSDTVHICLMIFEEKQVEFFGKPYYIDSPYNFGDNTSKYDIWIDKSSNLPFKVRREMSHDISVTTCRNIELNKSNNIGIIASDYYPLGYSIQAYGQNRRSEKISDLIGIVAPDWTLRDANNIEISLNDLESNVLMIQFTSVSCGPCRASIPFLKQLSSEYKTEDFDFVAIESFNRNSRVLSNYQKNNDFSYKFLISTNEVTSKYRVEATPVFYILDQNRVIRKIINGYGEKSTDREIRQAIEELI